MVLHVQFGAVFAFSEEDFAAAWMHFSVLSHVVNASLVNCPTIVLGIVLLDLLERVLYRVRVLDHVLPCLVLLDELLYGKREED